MVFLSGWLIGLFDGLVPGWWWVHGTGGGNMQREQTSPCSLCPNSGSSGIKQQKWDTASQGGQVGSRIDHWWRWSEQKSPPKKSEEARAAVRVPAPAPQRLYLVFTSVSESLIWVICRNNRFPRERAEATPRWHVKIPPSPKVHPHTRYMWASPSRRTR